MQVMTPPRLSVVATNDQSAIVASVPVRRGYELGDLVREVLFQLRAKPSSRVRLMCHSVGDDVPDLRLDAATVADAAAAGIELEVLLAPEQTAASETQAAVVEVILAITGANLDPDETTRALGLSPTRTDDPQIRIIKGRRKDTVGVWALRLAEVNIDELDGVLADALKSVQPRAATLRRFCVEHNADLTFELVAHLEEPSARIMLANAVLATLAELGSALWYDPLVDVSN
jgi:hypothetical protein